MKISRTLSGGSATCITSSISTIRRFFSGPTRHRRSSSNGYGTGTSCRRRASAVSRPSSNFSYSTHACSIRTSVPRSLRRISSPLSRSCATRSSLRIIAYRNLSVMRSASMSTTPKRRYSPTVLLFRCLPLPAATRSTGSTSPSSASSASSPR
ncbi:hypothetical protein D3C80_914190 [compost metagenome]